MNRIFARLAIVALVLSVAGFAQTPAAASPTGTKIGIVNIQAAIATSNEGQRDLQALDKKLEPRRTELQSMNTELENLKKQLSTQGDKLNETARANLVRQVDDKQKAFQRKYEDYQSDVQSQEGDIANRIGQKMVKVLDTYAANNGFSLVLDYSGQQSAVIWAAPSVDITKALIAAYNAQSGVPAPPPSAPTPQTPAGGVKK